MGGNRALKLSLSQVAHLRLLPVGLIILIIIFYMSRADARVSSSTISTGEGDQCQENSCGLATDTSRASKEITNYVQPRIGGGSLARRGDFPFHVGVYWNKNYVCGGVLIDNYRILTSKACSRSNLNGMQVALGDLNRTEEDGELFRKIRRIESHPTTNLAILFVDPIALDRDILTSRGLISPIGLPTESQYVQGNLIVTGWGSDQFGEDFSAHLKKTIISVTDCRSPRKGIFCSQQNQLGPCSGDSGGPAFKHVGGRKFKLIGIIAGANCEEQCNNPLCDHEYVDISQHLGWINWSS